MTATVDPTSPADGGFGSLEHASRAYTWLFVPGDRPDRFAKAAASGADAIIIDLEDAIAPDRKAPVRDVLSRDGLPDAPILLRVNGTATEWFAGDVTAALALGIDGLLLPKAETLDDVAKVRTAGL